MTTTAEQTQAMLDFMRHHTDLARGRLSHELEGRLQCRRLWDELTISLNALGGCTKTTKQWQKVWADKKYAAKKAKAAANKSATRTGGGPATALPLRGVDAAVAEIMGENYGLPETDAFVNAFPLQNVSIDGENTTATIATPASQPGSQQSVSILRSLLPDAPSQGQTLRQEEPEEYMEPVLMSPVMFAGVEIPVNEESLERTPSPFEPNPGPSRRAPRRRTDRYRTRPDVRTRMFQLEEEKVQELRALRRSVDALGAAVISAVQELRLLRR